MRSAEQIIKGNWIHMEGHEPPPDILRVVRAAQREALEEVHQMAKDHSDVYPQSCPEGAAAAGSASMVADMIENLIDEHGLRK